MKKHELSTLSQTIKTLIRERNQLERLLLKQESMIAASFYKKKNGACYLSTSINGESRHRYVRKSDEKQIKKQALEWRKFSQTISKWSKINQTLEQNIRIIGQLRCEPLPGGKKKD